MIVEPITTTDGLDAIAPEWHELFARCTSATPFQSPQWLIPWWKHVGQGSLFTLALRDDARRLIGLAPMYVYTQPTSASRDLFLLGIGTSDYLDVLLAPGSVERGVAAIFDYLESRADVWDVCDLQQLRSTSPLLAGAPSLGSPHAGETCPVLSLPASIDALSHHLGANLAQNLRYYRRRAQREGCVIEQATPDTLNEIFDALLALHAARWRERNEPGVLAAPSVQRAHRESLSMLQAAGMLRLYAMRRMRQIIAVFYGLADPPDARPTRSVYYYLGGFDPAHHAIGPGTLLIAHAVEQAIAQGADRFDFLRGQEAYKYLWGAKDTPVSRLVIPAPARRLAEAPQ